MKKIVIIILILCSSIMVYNDFLFEKNMAEGKEAIVNKKYAQAKKLFENAVNKKSDDREAMALYKQIEKLIDVINLEKEGNIEDAIDLCGNINNIHSEDDLIKKTAKNLNEEYLNKIEEKSEYEISLNSRLEESKALIQRYDYSGAKVILTKIISEIENTDTYYLQLDEAHQYLSLCN